MKKLFASLLAVMMLASMLVLPASAADYTITVNGTAAGHVYAAYQIFKGDLSAEGVLSNIKWGEGVNGPALLAALQGDDAFGAGSANQFGACTDAASTAKAVSAWSPDSLILDRFAEVVGKNLATASGTSTNPSGNTYTISPLQPGYYLVLDTTMPDNTGDAYTKYIIRVVRDVEVSPKGSVPAVTKTVHTAMDGTFKKYEDATMTYNVFFKLEGTLPSNYATDYPQYRYKFVDTLPAGLTYANNVTAFILHSTDATTPIAASAYSVDVDDVTRKTITFDFGNLKDSLPALLASDKIVVKYAATLNENAAIGATGNTNGVVLHYSNNPNQDGDVLDPDMGKTASDSATVYTYQLDVTKVDGIDTSKALAGAVFRLYRNDTDAHGVTIRRYAEVTDGKLTGSTTTPPAITEPLSTTDKTLLTSGAQGKFSVIGLDAGIYYLEEIKAPDGYNKMADPVRVTITPEFSANALTALKSDVDGVPGTGYADTGIVPVLVKNNAGATLPSTGGMGTTLFYVVGVVLMLGAVAVILAKKRETK